MCSAIGKRRFRGARRIAQVARHRLAVALALGLTLTLTSRLVRAQPDDDAHAPKIFPDLSYAPLTHESQLGIALMPGSGFRVLFPYNEGIFCGQNGKRACSGRLPVFLDVQPSYGVSARWDLVLDLRFGLEADFAHTRQLALAPGFRYWVEPWRRTKFFTTIQVAYDATEQHTSALTGYDLAIHNANGLMFEVMRDLGFYAQFADTIGFIRWLRFEIDLGVGVQARFP